MGSDKKGLALYEADTFLYRTEELENGFVLTMVCEAFAPERMSGKATLGRKKAFVFSKEECNSRFTSFVQDHVGKKLPALPGGFA